MAVTRKKRVANAGAAKAEAEDSNQADTSVDSENAVIDDNQEKTDQNDEADSEETMEVNIQVEEGLDKGPDLKEEQDEDCEPASEDAEGAEGDNIKDVEENIPGGDHSEEEMEDIPEEAQMKVEDVAEPTADSYQQKEDPNTLEEDNDVDEDDVDPEDEEGVQVEEEAVPDDEMVDADKNVIICDDEDEEKVPAEEDSPDDKDQDNTAEVLVVEDDEETLSYPESFSKLRQLTVNIGPIKQQDLMSRELHSILNLTWNFEIKFEKKIKEQEGGGVKSERPGYVRIPFSVNSPRFLVTVAKKLGNLRIDGRDMSVKFPEAFNNAVKDCEEYLRKMSSVMLKRKMKKVELMKRQIVVRNVPDKVEEDTIKSLFPEAAGVTMNTVTTADGTKKVGSVLLDFESEKACFEFLQSNKDVQIGDCKVKLTRNYDDPNMRHTKSSPNFSSARGGRRPFRGRGTFRGQFSSNRGRGILGNKPSFGSPSVRGGIRNLRRGTGKRPFSSSRGKGYQSSQGPPAQRMQSPDSPGRQQHSPNRAQTTPQRYTSRLSPGSSHSSRSKPYPDRPAHGSTQSMRANEAFIMTSSRPTQYTRGNKQGFRGGGRVGRAGRQARGGQVERLSSSRGGEEEDPLVMMSYLKNTLARMEEKMTQRPSSSYDHPGGQRKRKSSIGDSFYQSNKRAYGEDSRYSDRESSFDTSRHGNWSLGQYGNRSDNRGYGNSSSYQDNRQDSYRDGHHGNVRQGQFQSPSHGQRRYGGQGFSGNRW